MTVHTFPEFTQCIESPISEGVNPCRIKLGSASVWGLYNCGVVVDSGWVLLMSVWHLYPYHMLKIGRWQTAPLKYKINFIALPPKSFVNWFKSIAYHLKLQSYTQSSALFAI